MLLGHKYDNGSETIEESLKEHVDKVADICGHTCGKIGFESTGRLLGLLHDMGKTDPEVQRHMMEDNNEIHDHSTLGAAWLMNHYDQNGSKTNNVSLTYLSSVIECHHSGRRDLLSANGYDKFYKKYIYCDFTKYDKLTALYYDECVPLAELNDLLDKSLFEYKQFHNKLAHYLKDLPVRPKRAADEMWFYEGMMERFLYAALVDADWYATSSFVNNKPIKFESLPEWESMRDNCEEFLKKLQPKNNIDGIRSSISDECKSFANGSKGIYRLYVPTGGGKTFSGMRYCLKEAMLEKTEHIFYFAPYKTIINQNAEKYREMIGSDNVLIHHSDVLIDEESDEKAETIEEQMERWTSAPIIATSLVQYFDTCFAAPRRNIRRLAALSNSVILFDEVQSVPLQDTYLFDLSVNFIHEFLNCTVVMCTATEPPIEELTYPVRYSERMDMVSDINSKFADLRRTEVIMDIKRKKDSSEIAGMAMSINLPSVLIIVNLKKEAEKIYNEISAKYSGEVETFCLTTHMCRQHIEDELERFKNAIKNGKRTICVSTQLIEAGVDISVDSVIRTMSGLTSIAQAAGRCNRNGEGTMKKVYVVDSAEEYGKSMEHLSDIMLGREALRNYIDSGKAVPDLLSPEAIKGYYDYFFEDSSENRQNDVKRRTMEHEIRADGKEIIENTSMVELLSSNQLGIRHYEDDNGIWKQKPAQAFGTADNKYEAIGAEGYSVIVPYGEGKEIVADLCGEDKDKAYKAVKRAGKYTIQLFKYEFENLKDAMYTALDGTVYILNENHYDCDGTGLVEEAKAADLKIF
ncbi:MAG: CRISPR-associated helicase Cas3' [Catonella sp.]|nr:CRISPR-associated helicase Cas3' [Catonella sp.]